MPYLILTAAILSVLTAFYMYANGISGVITGDGIGYYSYLPATFIYHDWNMGFMQPHLTFCVSESGNIILRYPMGVSMLVSPFFFISHFLAPYTKFSQNGYSLIYQFGVLMSAFLFYSAGIILTYKILLERFSKAIARLSCFAITFGCAMLFYMIFNAAYSHIYSFCFISLFIFLTVKEKDFKNRSLFSFLLGLSLSFIFLLRNMNILVFLFYLVWDVKNIDDFILRIKNFISKKRFLCFVLGFILPLIPQMIYWKIQTGHLLINTYSYETLMCKYQAHACFKDHFDFLHPHILSALFSAKKGLFFYYPVMFFALFGLFKIKKYYKEMFFPIILFLAPIFVMLLSWSEWWWGFSFGQRVYIDYMALFALLIAAALKSAEDYASNKPKFKVLINSFTITVFLFLIILSLVFMALILTGNCNVDGSLVLKAL